MKWIIETTHDRSTEIDADGWMIEDGVLTFAKNDAVVLAMPTDRLVFAKRLDR